MLEAYPEDVKLVFKQYPLSFHRHARGAALASLAAERQGKFWEMHDKLFENYRTLGDEQGNTRFKDFAKELGLDLAKFEKDMNDSTLSSTIHRDMRQGADAKVTGTPAIYVNGRRVANRSFAGFKQMIEAALDDSSSTGSGSN